MSEINPPAWTDAELDEALAVLNAEYAPSTDEIAALRVRVVSEDGLAALPRARRSRRAKRALIGGAIAVVVGVGGGAAAAADGVFDQQAGAAFASGNTYPFHIDAHTAVLRVTASTPDGGRAEFWTAKQGKVKCGAVLLDDGGRRLPGKPYLPQAQCSDVNQPGGGEVWQSNKTGADYFIFANRTDADAVRVTFIDPQTQAITTAPVSHGYYVIFVPYAQGGSPDYGINVTHADGTTTVLQKPWAPETH